MSPVPADLRCWAEIDLSALERNVKQIRAALPPHIQYVAVIKADAYGHGMAQTISRLMHTGVDAFAVANLDEAATVAEVGSGWPVLVLGPILPAEISKLQHIAAIPAIGSAGEAMRLANIAASLGEPQPIHVKIDTGMGRFGVWHEDAIDLLEQVQADRRLAFCGVFTHFSSADQDEGYTRTQRDRFLEILERTGLATRRELLIHADNSAGLETLPPDGPFNAVRVGLLQFGVRPYPKSVLGDVLVEPVLSFRARVGFIKKLPAGTAISYGQTHLLERNSQVAVITAGYGDGIPTQLSNRGAVLIGGQRCPILGRVTMDQTIVDVTDLDCVALGDTATFIGIDGDSSISAETFSEQSGSIPYETFCSITKRVPRIYRTDTGT